MTIQFKEIPILFSTPMVKSILSGSKTQTRRVVKPQPEPPRAIYNEKDAIAIMGKKEEGTGQLLRFNWATNISGREITDGSIFTHRCPYGEVGHVLWVRETWAKKNDRIYYKADCVQSPKYETWKPSIFMPKAACRIYLKITNVRVERLQDISEEDAIAEGAHPIIYHTKEVLEGLQKERNYQEGFKSLWQSINGEESWNQNIWVWVIEFERIEL